MFYAVIYIFYYSKCLVMNITFSAYSQNFTKRYLHTSNIIHTLCLKSTLYYRVAKCNAHSFLIMNGKGRKSANHSVKCNFTPELPLIQRYVNTNYLHEALHNQKSCAVFLREHIIYTKFTSIYQ